MKLLAFVILLPFFVQAADLKTENAIGHATKIFFDSSRERPLVTEIWYPAVSDRPFKPHNDNYARGNTLQNAPFRQASGPYPLVIFSHSSKGSRLETAWLMESLAQNGYVTVAVDHFGDTWHSYIPEIAAQSFERPIDLLYVLAALSSDPFFGTKIRQNKIALISYGKAALGALWLIGARANNWNFFYQKKPEEALSLDPNSQILAKRLFKDGRFQAVILLAPLDVKVFDKGGLDGALAPTLIMTGQNDQVSQFKDNGLFLANRMRNGSHILLKGDANHDAFRARPSHSPQETTQEALLKKKITQNIIDFLDRHIR